MDILLLAAIAYALSGGIKAGSLTAQQHSKTTLEKKPKPIDMTERGRNTVQGAINSVARVYTWGSGAREGWRQSVPETKKVIKERRDYVKAEKEKRRTAKEAGPGGSTATVVDDIVDAEIVEDEPELNTGSPKAPTPPDPAKVAEATAAGASADATVRVTIVTDPPREATPPRPAPATAPAPPASGTAPVPPPRPPAPPRPAPRHTPDPELVDQCWDPAVNGGAGGWWGFDPDARGGVGTWWVWDPNRNSRGGWTRPDLCGATDWEPPPDLRRLRVVKEPPPAGGAETTPRSTMSSTLPASTTRVTEINGVDTLMVYLAQLSRFARMEREDAAAAIARLRELEAKAEYAYNAAVGAKYDTRTLQELAAIVERLGKLRQAREADLRSSEAAEHNAATASANVWTRHGGINEAVANAPVDMAESTTYGD